MYVLYVISYFVGFFLNTMDQILFNVYVYANLIDTLNPLSHAYVTLLGEKLADKNSQLGNKDTGHAQ